MKESDPTPVPDAGDGTLLERDNNVSPPHGDELREEVTFGRTDRYTNVDDEQATREQPAEDVKK